jgi:hypothetical protein
MKCEEEGCKENATHSVTLNIPAAGVPIDCHQPLRLYIDVKLCRGHAVNFGNGFHWHDNEGLRESIENFISESHFGVRDFSKTFSSAIKLTDSSYVEVQKYLNREK